MTEEIIIDGVNVAECKAFILEDEAGYKEYCSILDLECEDDCKCEGSNCYYKQLQRLKQENRILKIEKSSFKKYKQALVDINRALLGVNGASPRSSEQIIKIKQTIEEVLK